MVMAILVIFIVVVLLAVVITVLSEDVRNWLKCNKDSVQTMSSLLGAFAIILTGLGLYITYTNNIQQQQTVVKQERRAANAQAEASAVGMLQSYLALAAQHPELASRQTWKDMKEARYRYPDEVGAANARKVHLARDYTWFATDAIYTAETLYNLTRQGHWATTEWDETVMGIVDQHQTYVLHNVFPCDQYSPRFVEATKKHLKKPHLCRDVQVGRASQ